MCLAVSQELGHDQLRPLFLRHPRLETKLESISKWKLRTFLPAHLDGHAVMPSSGPAGGILVAWDTSLVFGQVVALHKYHLTVRLASTGSNSSVLLTTVYAPCIAQDRPLFFETLAVVVGQVNEPWMIIGDFNMYRSETDKSRGRLNWSMDKGELLG